MATKDISVKQQLIEAGKTEFLQYGYEKASLRRISTMAGVSTGAIYFFFQNKEDFFREILEETATILKLLLKNSAESELSGSRSSEENDIDFITFLCAHKKESMILLEKSSGTIYADFRKELCEVVEQAYIDFYKQLGGRDYDTDIVKIVVSMRIHGLLELLHGDYSMKQIRYYTKLLSHYGDGGFESMMKLYKDVAENPVE